MKTLSLVLLILSMMVYIGLKFFLAPSPSWGMAFKSRSQIFHTNVIFSLPEQRSGRAIVLSPASALASASTNVKSFR